MSIEKVSVKPVRALRPFTYAGKPYRKGTLFEPLSIKDRAIIFAARLGEDPTPEELAVFRKGNTKVSSTELKTVEDHVYDKSEEHAVDNPRETSEASEANIDDEKDRALTRRQRREMRQSSGTRV